MTNYQTQSSLRRIFGTFRRTLTKAECAKVACIADACGVEFVYQGRVAGNATSGWFTCRNYGDASTRAHAHELYEALKAEGIEL